MALLAALAAAVAVATAESIPATASLSRRLAAWAACRRYAANPGRAARRAQEWQALISGRPGRRVLGLLTAARFALLAARRPGPGRVHSAGTTGPRLVGVAWDGEQAVTAIYWAHYRSLVRLAVLLVGDVAAAENVVQDSFVAMHGARGRLRDGDKALSYLRHSVVNRSRSVLRHQVVVDRNAPMPAPDLHSAGQGSLAELERSAVVMALSALPARQREAMALKYYAGLSQAQIAAAMGVSQHAVKMHTARAITALRGVQSVDRQSVAIAARRAVTLPVSFAAVGSVVLVPAAVFGHLPRVIFVAGLVAPFALGAAFGAVQLRRMPPQARRLFLNRRVALPLGMYCGYILTVAAAATAMVPARALAGTLVAWTCLMFACWIPVGLRNVGALVRNGVQVSVSLVVAGVIMFVVSLGMTATSPRSFRPLASSASPVRELTEDQLRPGDCLRGSNMGLGTGSAWPGLVTAVPCTQQHLAEVFFAGNIWPQSLAYPGDTTVGNEAYDRCANTIAAYVGPIKYLGTFGFDDIAPDGITWPSGDRLVVCVAYRYDKRPVNYSIRKRYR